MNKKISLISSNFNHARYLPELFESILSLSYQPDEFILVDDGSTDNSIEIIESYQEKIPQMLLLKNDKNRGLHFSFNRGIDLARYDLVGLSAVDDLFFPNFFEKCLSMFNEHPDLALVFSDLFIFQDEKPYRFHKLGLYPATVPQIFTPEFLVKAMRRNPTLCIPSHSCLYRKDILLSLGKHDRNLLSVSDYYLNAQIGFRYPIGYIPEALAGSRKLKNSYGHAVSFHFQKRLQILDHMMKKLWTVENLQFQKMMVNSRYLAWNGYFLILYVFLHPKYWRYFFLFTHQILKHKYMLKKIIKYSKV